MDEVLAAVAQSAADSGHSGHPTPPTLATTFVCAHCLVGTYGVFPACKLRHDYTSDDGPPPLQKGFHRVARVAASALVTTSWVCRCACGYSGYTSRHRGVHHEAVLYRITPPACRKGFTP